MSRRRDKVSISSNGGIPRKAEGRTPTKRGTQNHSTSRELKDRDDDAKSVNEEKKQKGQTPSNVENVGVGIILTASRFLLHIDMPALVIP